MEIALALLGSGALATVISWLLHRIDRKQDKQDQIISGMTAVDNKLQQHLTNATGQICAASASCAFRTSCAVG